MKKTLSVQIDAIKHELNREGDLMTTLHLELPSGTDLKHVQRAHRIAKRKEAGTETARFVLRIVENGGKRTWNLISKGSKTKDYKVVAVCELDFNANHRFEPYLDAWAREKATVELDVLIESPQRPLLNPPDADDDRDSNGVQA
jgi:hypothetical protein